MMLDTLVAVRRTAMDLLARREPFGNPIEIKGFEDLGAVYAG